MKWGKCDFKELEAFRDKLEGMSEGGIDEFCEACAKELAARLLRKVIKRTPVGDYSGDAGNKVGSDGKVYEYWDVEYDGEQYYLTESTKTGGTLRRGWTAQTEEEAETGSGKPNVNDYVAKIRVVRSGSAFTIEISNPVSYASYVEYGHRQTPGRYVPAINKKLKDGWVEGHFMMTISEREIQNAAPALLQKKLYEFLQGVVK